MIANSFRSFILGLSAAGLIAGSAAAETATVNVSNFSKDCDEPTVRKHTRCVPSGRTIRQVDVKVVKVVGASRITGPANTQRDSRIRGDGQFGIITNGGRCVVIETTARPRGKDPITRVCRGRGLIQLQLKITY